jgi:hypothetical protein
MHSPPVTPLCAVLYSECKRMSKERNYAANVYEMMMQQQQPIVVTPPHHQISTQTLSVSPPRRINIPTGRWESVSKPGCLHYPRLTKKAVEGEEKGSDSIPIVSIQQANRPCRGYQSPQAQTARFMRLISPMS